MVILLFMVGYLGMLLLKKLGIKSGYMVVLFGVFDGFEVMFGFLFEVKVLC